MSHLLLILATIAIICTLGCTKSQEWKSEEWRGKGQQPLPLRSFKYSSKINFNNHKIEFRTQEIQGVPVEGSFAKIVIDQHKEIPERPSFSSWVRYQSVDEGNLPKKEKILQALAKKSTTLKQAKKYISSLNCLNKSQVLDHLRPAIVWRKSAWDFVFKGSCENRSGQPFEFSVLQSGAIDEIKQTGIGFNPVTKAVTVNASLYPKGPKNSSLSLLRLLMSEQPNYLSNPLINVVSDSGANISGLDQVSSIKPADIQFDMLEVYFYSNSALSWLTKQFSFQPEPLKIRTHVGYPEKTNAAFYFQREVRLGTGDGQVFTNLSWDPSIVIHEVFHSVIETLTRLPFRGEGGSLNEALADSLTALYLNDPNMGASSYNEGPYQRTLENNLRLINRQGALYADSLILSGTIWEIKKSIDAQTAQQLIEYLLTYLVPASDFAETKVLITRWYSAMDPGLSTYGDIGLLLKKRGWM